MSLKNVQIFYERLLSDEAFKAQIQTVSSKEECSSLVKAAGYDFTQQEFEDYTAQLLEADISSVHGLLKVGERELEAVHGGFIQRPRDMGQTYGLPPLPLDYFENQ